MTGTQEYGTEYAELSDSAAAATQESLSESGGDASGGYYDDGSGYYDSSGYYDDGSGYYDDTYYYDDGSGYYDGSY